jgi:putative spermidine/putrescine transport system permease protein
MKESRAAQESKVSSPDHTPGIPAPAESSFVELRESRGEAHQRKRERAYLYLLIPTVAFLAVFFTYPLVDMLLRSVMSPAGFTLEHYERIVTRSLYHQVFLITLQIAFTVTVLCLFLGYPVAYLLATVPRRTAGILIVIVLLPFFTSILVRTYAWMVLLGSEGLINQLLRVLGLATVKLLYNRIGVLIGMTYVLLPYMILILYSVMKGIDRSLLQAAYSLGASEWRAFWRIFFPLSMPGVVGGSLLVFILALGYFITPRLMGGNRDQMIAMVIEHHVEQTLNWGFAAALATLLLVAMVLLFWIYNRVLGLQTLFESKT